MLRRLAALLLPLLLAAPPLPLQGQYAWPAPSAREEGPHVLWEERQARILRVRDGILVEELRKPPFSLELPGLAARPLHLDGLEPAPAQDRFPGPERILAVSDVHGAWPALRQLLQAQGVVDAQLTWRFGKGHLVVVGDCFDRGDGVTEILWFLRALEGQALRSGGRVHVLLGNHEAMVLRGDLRYLNPKYQNLLKGPLPVPVPRLFGPRSELGRWLRSRPALVCLGDSLFVHGGPSPALVAQRETLGALNSKLRKALDAPEGEPGAAFLLGREGPLWFRGAIPGAIPSQDLGKDQLQSILGTFGARRLVVGHTTLERVTAFHGGLVFGIDAGLKDGRPGEAWVWERGRAWRGRADGTREPLEVPD